MKHTFRGSVTDLSTISSGLQTGNVSSIEIMRVGKWNHPIYGEFEITNERLERFKDNFDSGIRKAVAIDIEHKSDEGAVGWVKELEFADGILMAKVEWTDEGAELIKKKKYRFFSPEFSDEYVDSATDAEYRDVLIGGAITNRPFFQELNELVLSDRSIETYKMAELKCPECKKLMKDKAEMDSHMKSKHPEKYNLKGGDKKMALTREELKSKLVEDPNYKPTEEDGVSEELLKEVTQEVADEAGNGGEGGEGDEGEEGKESEEEKEAREAKEAKETEDKKKKKFSEKKMVQVSEKELEELRFNANAGLKAHKQLREMSVAEEVKKFTISSDNKEGVILPKDSEKVKAFALTLGDNQRKAFFEVLSALPKGNLLNENGSGEQNTDEPITDDPSAEMDRRAKKLMSETPDKFKTYREALYEAEKQMKAEGIDVTV